MITPIVITLVALLLFVLIGYNIIAQYKEKIESEKRILLAKQGAIISEVDDLLLTSTQIPFSKILLLILQRRIKNALLLLIQNYPQNAAIKEHLNNTELRIQDIKANHKTASDTSFHTPQSDIEALALLKATKKIRAILRSEHTKGKISTETFVSENKKVEIIQLKINLENGIKRVKQAQETNQFGSANQLASKLLRILNSIEGKDTYLTNKQQELLAIQKEIQTHLETTNSAALKAIDKKEQESSKADIDVIFQDKKKW
jgi:hypothetical protein